MSVTAPTQSITLENYFTIFCGHCDKIENFIQNFYQITEGFIKNNQVDSFTALNDVIKHNYKTTIRIKTKQDTHPNLKSLQLAHEIIESKLRIIEDGLRFAQPSMSQPPNPQTSTIPVPQQSPNIPQPSTAPVPQQSPNIPQPSAIPIPQTSTTPNSQPSTTSISQPSTTPVPQQSPNIPQPSTTSTNRNKRKNPETRVAEQPRPKKGHVDGMLMLLEAALQNAPINVDF